MVEVALVFIEGGPGHGAAFPDISLGGKMVFPVTDEQMKRTMPLLFTTGYNAEDIPARYAGVTHCKKSVRLGSIVREIEAG